MNQVEIVEYEHGRLLYLTRDVYAARFLSEFGQYSPGEVELLGWILRPGDCVVEVGAHLGAITVPMARLVRPGSVLAFEPQHHVYNLLCGNIALNGLSDVVAPVCAAAGREVGRLVVPAPDYDSPSNFGGISLTEDPACGRPVEVVALDNVLRGTRAIRLLKIDAEGMERDVLLGGSETIGRTRPFLYFEDDRPERSEALRETAKSLGYRLFRHMPPYVTRVGDPTLRQLVSLNVLGVPAELPARVELEEL